MCTDILGITAPKFWLLWAIRARCVRYIVVFYVLDAKFFTTGDWLERAGGGLI